MGYVLYNRNSLPYFVEIVHFLVRGSLEFVLCRALGRRSEPTQDVLSIYRPPSRARDFGRLHHKRRRLSSSLEGRRTKEAKKEEEKKRRQRRKSEVGCEGLAQNTVTHNSLIGTPQDYDNLYHLQEDYYSSHPPC